MDVEVAAHELVVVPGQALLTAPDATFPIYIDPAFSKPEHGRQLDPHEQLLARHQLLHQLPQPSCGSARQWNTPCKWRSYMRFDTAQLAGATIQAAEFAVTADHVANCAGASTNLLFRNNISAMNTATWNSTSSGNVQTIGTEKFDANESSCPSGDQKKVYDDGTARVLEGRMQSQANARASQITFALISSNEGDQMGWSNFIPGSVALIITPGTTPRRCRPGLTITTDCGTSCAWARSGTPTPGRRSQPTPTAAPSPGSSSRCTTGRPHHPQGRVRHSTIAQPRTPARPRPVEGHARAARRRLLLAGAGL